MIFIGSIGLVVGLVDFFPFSSFPFGLFLLGDIRTYQNDADNYTYEYK